MKILKIVPITEQELFRRDWLLHAADNFEKQAEEAREKAYKILTDKVEPMPENKVSDFALLTRYGLKAYSVVLSEDKTSVALVENYSL